MLKSVKESMIKEKKEALEERTTVYKLKLKEFKKQNARLINEIVSLMKDIDTLRIQPED